MVPKNNLVFHRLIPHRVEGCRGEYRGGYFSPPVFLHLHRLLFFISATCICSPTAFVCSPPAFEDGAGGVSREDTRGEVLEKGDGSAWGECWDFVLREDAREMEKIIRKFCIALFHD